MRRLQIISIHALRVEGDSKGRITNENKVISIHALRVEGDGEEIKAWLAGFNISIHALRVEGDPPKAAQQPTINVFLSTPSGWRATRGRGAQKQWTCVFLSTPSGWRATAQTAATNAEQSISIHALRVEGDHSCIGSAH